MQEFRTSVTGRAFILASPAIISSFLLLYFSWEASQKFSPADPTRYIFAGLPALVALCILLAVGLIFYRYSSQSVTLEGNRLNYRGGGLILTMDVVRMAYSPPVDSGFLKIIMFSDGVHFIQIPRPFMSELDFVQLANEIDKRRRGGRLSSNTSYSL